MIIVQKWTFDALVLDISTDAYRSKLHRDTDCFLVIVCENVSFIPFINTRSYIVDPAGRLTLGGSEYKLHSQKSE